jgi:hypothetical protein
MKVLLGYFNGFATDYRQENEAQKKDFHRVLLVFSGFQSEKQDSQNKDNRDRDSFWSQKKTGKDLSDDRKDQT